MNWYIHACTLTQRLLCTMCSKLQDVIPSVILSKKSCINKCLITDRYIVMTIWIFQDTVWYQLLHHSHITPTSGKQYSLVPRTWSKGLACEVTRYNAASLLIVQEHERNCLPANITGKKTILAVNDGVNWPHVKGLNYQKDNKLRLRCAELHIQNGGGHF